MAELRGIYENIRVKARSANAPALLYAKENPLFDLIRRYRDTLREVVVNDHNLEEKVKAVFSGTVSYEADPSERFGIQDMLQEAMQKTVKLPSGGEIHIEETRAFVAIDVDSAGNVARGETDNLNREAAVEIARQILLRNLAGKSSSTLPVRANTALCAALWTSWTKNSPAMRKAPAFWD